MKMIISGGEEYYEEKGRGCGRDSQVGVDWGHLAAQGRSL